MINGNLRFLTVLLTTCTLAPLAIAASVVWDFNPNGVTGAVGATTESLNGSATGLAPLDPSTPLVTVSGFNADNSVHSLYWKVAGADEHGIGFTNPDTLDNELTLNANGTSFANYMQIDVSNVLAAGGTSLEIRVQSVTAGEEFDVYGSSSANSLATKLISGSTADNTLIPIPLDSGHYDPFYFVTVTPQGGGRLTDNVLLDAVAATVPTPEPASVSMLALGAVALVKRRRA